VAAVSVFDQNASNAGCGTCPEKLGPILNNLLNCLALSMQQCGTPACRLFLSTDANGMVPWDACCSCSEGVGQAWVNVWKVEPLLIQSPNVGTGCPPIFQASVHVGVLRCAVVQTDDSAPDPSVITSQSLAILQDRAVINNAIFGCWSDTIDSDNWTIGEWLSLGPNGGCAGGQVSLTIRFNG
jgi:hypothetical protein